MTRASSLFLVVISWQMRPDFLHLDHALELHLEQQPVSPYTRRSSRGAFS
jgi:hypothetical protein